MTDARIITGNQAAALAARLCDVQVIAAYPITPQSQLAEMLSLYVESGQLRAEYVRVEGEHSAMTVCIGASTVGARVFTATSSNGLLYMHEQLHWAAGSRLPIVMCCVNRGVGAPWSIFNDQQDSLAQRDTGWIQMYCRDNQEILDTIIQAYRIAETVYAPVMVCYDGFVLSHTMMPVISPPPAAVRKFLPPYKPHTILDANNPMTINSVLLPNRRPDCRGGALRRLHGDALQAAERSQPEPGDDPRGESPVCGGLRARPRRDALDAPDGGCRRHPHEHGVACRRGDGGRRRPARGGDQGRRRGDPRLQALPGKEGGRRGLPECQGHHPLRKEHQLRLRRGAVLGSQGRLLRKRHPRGHPRLRGGPRRPRREGKGARRGRQVVPCPDRGGREGTE